MLYFLLIWAILLVSSYSVGNGYRKLAQLSSMRLGDRVLLSVWLGLVSLSLFFLTIALWLPLTLPLGLIICLLISGVGWLSYPEGKQELSQIKIFLQNHRWLSLLSVIVSGGAIGFVTQQVQWSESAFYHFQAVRWLSEQGVVHGLVLLMKNLGIVSSWFALIAPWNGSLIEFRAGALANGLIIFLFLIHLILAGYRLGGNQERSSDRFIASFSVLILFYTLISQEFQLIIISPSPDLPIVLLIGVLSWLLLVISESNPRKSVNKLPIETIPLVLALGAFAIKLSAIPLLIIAIIYYIYQHRSHFQYLMIGGIITIVFLLPILIVGYQMSGCLFYPASSFCFDVPWSLPLAETQAFEVETTSLERWFGTPPSDKIALIWLFEQWLKSRPLNRLMFYLILLSTGCGIVIFRMNRFSLTSAHYWLIALGFLGIIFVLLQGPLIRFALGYLLIIPAVALPVSNLSQVFRKLGKVGKKLLIHTQSSRLFWLTLSLGISLGLSYPNIYEQWLIPPALPETVFLIKQAKNFTYYVPIGSSCWATQLPCNSNNSAFSPLYLRKGSSDLTAGFSRN